MYTMAQIIHYITGPKTQNLAKLLTTVWKYMANNLINLKCARSPISSFSIISVSHSRQRPLPCWNRDITSESFGQAHLHQCRLSRTHWGFLLNFLKIFMFSRWDILGIFYIFRQVGLICDKWYDLVLVWGRSMARPYIIPPLFFSTIPVHQTPWAY